ncbi:FtsK/SpoIIIE domain-containing protein [Streptomyces uncialis]|uniref:FtsK/SpoIIIE domain-containing protein n=1 Tax=Streptomyces uncialis TaxID=1048205 RepID=UPI002251EAA7|nr:FtsK/SpoIIIE domain-containing protein [Streptomyces uncialis]MCX4663482.1 FtsK/SpoIIIE domain-containing protein [Streptomyces uncialis]
MTASLIVWTITALIVTAALTQEWWEPRLKSKGVRVPPLPLRWWLLGYPGTALRIWSTWRPFAHQTGLSIARRPGARMVGRDLLVHGEAVRPRPPRMGWPMPTRTGLTVRVIMHPGQTPAPYAAAARAMAHAWRVHSVRVTTPRRGHILITAVTVDPLTGKAPAPQSSGLLTDLQIGRNEDGEPWVIDLRTCPHWLITGATQSGKSTCLTALVASLARQPVALVGIDLKGGLELGPVSARFSGLATSREGAVDLLRTVMEEIVRRADTCRTAGVKSVWDLAVPPPPLVLLVDELAELYLSDGTRADRDTAEQAGTLLLRVVQLGAGVGVHAVVAGQRVGSDIGPRVTALRAQLGGRIAHRGDAGSVEMTLGDLSPDAVVAAQSIAHGDRGIAIVADGAGWMRVRSRLVTPEEIREIRRIPPVPLATPETPGSTQKGTHP